MELAPDAVIGVGSEGLIVLVNAQTELLFGYPREELIGEPIKKFIARFEASVPATPNEPPADPRSRAGTDMELLGRRKDGSEFCAEMSLSDVRTDEGKLAVASIRDISHWVEAAREKTRLEAELQAGRRVKVEGEKQGLEEQLEQMRRLESVGQLAGGIAHDFNNLLAVITNYAEFVATEIGEKSPAFDDVEEIRRAAERGAALTRQLLIFSRRDVVRPKVLDLNDLLGEVEKLLTRSLGEHVELEANLDKEAWPVMADPGQLEQVFVNLAVNARDAMPQGGELVIETTNTTLDAEFCELHGVEAPGPYVRVVISDSGSGMSPEIVARAFEPFYTTKPKGEGTGLGLATAYGIITEAGGAIHLYSEPGLGTSVKIYLPASSGEPLIPQESGTAPKQASGAESVLIVEDEPAVRRLTERILIGAGYTVLAADGPERALELLNDDENSFDLLITDVVMPGMLGPELVEQAIVADASLRVLYMSGYAHQALARQQVDHGEFEFVEKPFNSRSLLAAVRAALDTQHPRTVSAGA